MPGLFEQFPHTNLHELNLDWIIDLINQFKEDLENSAVLSVNGQTGHVTLYESENVILPPLPSGVDQWRLVRLVNGQYVGILFYDNHAYLQRGNETMRLLTLEDIPSDSGVVSWNGLTGVVNVTGEDIPVDDTADANSIAEAITNETTERVNQDNALQNEVTHLITQTSSRYIHHLMFQNTASIEITLPHEPDNSHFYNVEIVNANQNINSFSSIATTHDLGVAMTITNTGSTLTIKRTDNATMWGVSHVTISANFNIFE